MMNTTKYNSIMQNRVNGFSCINRADFDPTVQRHLDSLKKFLETGNWGDIQFFCEYPYTDVPTTVLMKYAAFKLSADLKSRAKKRENTVDTII